MMRETLLAYTTAEFVGKWGLHQKTGACGDQKAGRLGGG